MATETRIPYRDATYSATTQEHLRELLGRLTSQPGWNADPCVHALADVISRWDENDATEIFVDEQRPTSPLLSPDPIYVDSDIRVYKAACPSCARPLEWAIQTPPIPMTLFTWIDDGRHVTECPDCDESLPEGDLTKLDTGERS